MVALGFVLIYKATELVNFAQGDLLMLGAFVAYMAVVMWGLDYWVGFLIAIVVIAAFGALLDMTVLRRVIGQPQFAVVMLTIGLGAMFRTFASVTWGSEIYTLPTPFSGRDQHCRRDPQPPVPVDHRRHADPVWRALWLLQVHTHWHRHAGHIAEPACCVLYGHPGQAGLLAGVGDLGGGGDGRWHPAWRR